MLTPAIVREVGVVPHGCLHPHSPYSQLSKTHPKTTSGGKQARADNISSCGKTTKILFDKNLGTNLYVW
jgi:hypothetical protein